MGVEVHGALIFTQPGIAARKEGYIAEAHVQETVGVFSPKVDQARTRQGAYATGPLPAAYLMTTVTCEDQFGTPMVKTDTNGIGRGQSLTTPLGIEIKGI